MDTNFFCPLVIASKKILDVNVNKSSKGAGPLALPPNVLSLAPCGRILLTSNCGICPA